MQFLVSAQENENQDARNKALFPNTNGLFIAKNTKILPCQWAKFIICFS